MRRLEVEKCNVCGGKVSRPVASGYDFEYGTTLEEFHYVQCASCGHIYLRDPPVADALATIYPASYLPYNFDRRLHPAVRTARNFVQRRKAAFYRKLLPEAASILEVGAGSGLLMEALRDFGCPGWQLTANDFTAERIEHLKAKGIKLAIGNFEDLAFDEKFDGVIMNQTIEHFYDPDAVLAHCTRLLKPGGAIVIETPNHFALDRWLFARRHWGGYHIPRHFHVYSRNSMCRHLSKHGLQVIGVEYLLSPSFWIQSLHHLALDRRLPRLSRFFTVNNIPLLAFFSLVDWVLSVLASTSNMRVTARLAT